MDNTAPLPFDTEQKIQHLYSHNLFLDAYLLGIDTFGAVIQWPSKALQIKGLRLLSQLGLYRTHAALALKLWRNQPDDPDYYIEALYSNRLNRSQLEQLEHIEQLLTSHPDHPGLNHSKAQIFSNYRDFDNAEQTLNNLPDSDSSAWEQCAIAHLKISQDQYSEALAIVEEALTKEATCRNAIQLKAQLLQLKSEPKQALDFLKPHTQTSQSWSMTEQLFKLAIETEDYAIADQALQTLKKLPPQKEKHLTERLNQHKADLLCAQQKYTEALEYIEKTSLFNKRIAETITQKNNSKKRKIIEVPFIRQKNMTCAPASLSAITQFWGQPVNQETIIEKVCYGGTQAHDERKWARQNGWYTCEFDMHFDAIKALIDQEIPILLGTVEPGSAHLQIVAGYDESMGTYLLRDPYHPRLQELLIRESEEYYRANGPRCLLLLPKDQTEKIKGLKLPSQAQYDYLFNIREHLAQTRREKAQALLLQLKTKCPTHRLTYEATQELAHYDKDNASAISAIEGLLTLYPDNINLQLRKISLLDEFESTAATENYIKTLFNEEAHFLIKSRYASHLSHDQRQQSKTNTLYKQLLRQRSTDAPTLYGYAGQLWSEQNYQKAYVIYRLLACLEDTNDYYASSYFKAAMHHNDTEAALKFLRGRFERFSKTSSYPARALFDAYDSLEKTTEGLQILEHAITQRPNDADLLLYTASQYLYSGQPNKTKTLLLNVKNKAPASTYNSALAEYYDYIAQPEKSMAALKKTLAIEPLNYSANARLLRLANHHNKKDEANQHLNTLLQRFPHDVSLLRLNIQWLNPQCHNEIVEAYKNFTKLNPNNAWGWRGYAHALIKTQHYTEAESAAKTAIDIEPETPQSHGTLADVYQSQNKFEPAKQLFKKSIRLSCDYSHAINTLIECSTQPDQQQDDLRFIHEQLMLQTSSGDGILDFYYLAKEHFNNTVIQDFIDAAMTSRPDLWQTWVIATLHQSQQDLLFQAEEIALKGSQKFPLLPRMQFELAETLRLQNKDNQAVTQYKKTLSLSPGWSKPANALSDLLVKQERWKDAVDIQKRLITHNPKSPMPFGYLADIYRLQGDTDNQREALLNAINIDNEYSFAWTNLYRLDKNTREQTLTKLKNCIKEHPNNIALREILCRLDIPKKEKIQTLEDFLLQHPQNITAISSLLEQYSEAGKTQKALTLTDISYWPMGRPSNITVAHAKIIADSGDLEKAVQIITELTERNEQYYDAWRYLAIWQHELKNTPQIIKAAKQCVALHPHDSNVLCFAAEKIQDIKPQQPLALRWLKHAFELDMTDQYNALSYIDLAIDQGEFGDATKALGNLESIQSNPYTQARWVNLALTQNQDINACKAFENMLGNLEDETSVLNYAWQQFVSADKENLALNTLEQRLNQKQAINPIAGRLYANYHSQHLKLGAFNSRVKTLDMNITFSQNYIEGYLRYLLNNELDIPADVEKKIKGTCKKYTILKGLCGYIFCNQDKNKKVIEYLKNIENQDDAEGWMLYFYAIAARSLEQRDLAESLMQKAAEYPRDNYFEDIIIWITYDELINQKTPSNLSFIENKNDDELSGVSQYIRTLALTLNTLGSDSFDKKFEETSPLLRLCQQKYQAVQGNRAADVAKYATRRYIGESLKQRSFLTKLVWLWRLSNHF